MSEFHRLVEHEIPRLRRYARALTRETNRADDLVQDTLVRAISKSHLWQDGTDIRAWLFTIMHNQHVNSVRRALREETTVNVEQVSSTLVATSEGIGRLLGIGPRRASSYGRGHCWAGHHGRDLIARRRHESQIQPISRRSY